MHTSCYTTPLDVRNHFAGWLYSYPAIRETADLNYETLCPTLAKPETLSQGSRYWRPILVARGE
jgi:hypothetical protein